MSTKSPIVSTLCAASIILSGCATTPLVTATRVQRTGIARDLTVGEMVLYYEHCAEHRDRTGANCAGSQISAHINETFARCLDQAFEHATLPTSSCCRRTLSTARAGELQLAISGESGWVVPVLLFIPLPPMPHGSRTEAKGCRAMGDAVAQFLYSQATPVKD